MQKKKEVSKLAKSLLDELFGVGFSSKKNKSSGSHNTLYRKNSNDHISWDTDKKGNHKKGTGHRDKDGKKTGKSW